MKWRIGNAQWTETPLTDDAVAKRMASIPILKRFNNPLECDLEALNSLRDYRNKICFLGHSDITPTHSCGLKIEVI